jgi:ubiquinone/menaquinone biosynthesis C-methylase UbiE
MAKPARGMSYDAPATYAKLIGPRYTPIAAALVDAAALRKTDDVLELGAGTGLCTKRTAPHVRSVIATDASAAMLDHARKSIRRMPGLTFALLDYTQPFPFLDGSFDLVLSGLNFVQDLRQTLVEIERVLKPSGRLALSMWGSDYHEKRIMNDALEAVGGGKFPPARPSNAVRRLEGLGWRAVKRTDVPIEQRFANVDEYIAYRRGFGRPTAWTAAYYDRYLRALHRRAARDTSDGGTFVLGWVQTVITARRRR